jgi:uncharacterized protein YoxC
MVLVAIVSAVVAVAVAVLAVTILRNTASGAEADVAPEVEAREQAAEDDRRSVFRPGTALPEA